MTIYTKTAVDVFAPTTAGGVPRAVVNADAQVWGTEIQTVVAAALAGVGEVQGTWDASSGTFPGSGTADTGDAWIVTTAGTTGGVAFRVGDRIVSITTNSSTSTYAGNWLRLAANLDPVVSATDSGAGTANAIQVVGSKVVSASGGQLVAFNVFEANTGTTVTLQITDAAGAVISGLSVKTASGADPAVGALSAGLSILGQIEDTIFRILSDLGAATDRAAAEAAASTATTKAGEASDARDKAQEWAENPEDDEVETGQFSALHHATKAAASATTATTKAGEASDSAAAAAAALRVDYAAFWYNDDESAIAEGGWPLTRRAMRSFTLSTLYAEITHGEAGDSIDIEIFVNGISVYGPETVTFGSSLDEDALAIAIAVGDMVGVDTDDVTGTPYGLWIQAGGA